MKIVICGLSITSSWGNGHATTYRGLVQALSRRGHEVLFLERDKPWYAENRDLPSHDGENVRLYQSPDDLERRFSRAVANADVVIVGSFVPDGVSIAQWVLETAHGVVAFYDIDTPVTLAKLAARDAEYLTGDLIPRFHLYLSFTGGPTLNRLERDYGAKKALPLYCSVDPSIYYPESDHKVWDLGYLGTYSTDRQPALDRLMLEPARMLEQSKMVVAGSLYPADLEWPANVHRIEHLAPGEHRKFYNSQRFTLNVTRCQMIAAGYSPSIRLFEAAACGVPIISDFWVGLDEILKPGKEILIANGPQDVVEILNHLSGTEARQIASLARSRILAEHTADVRAAQLEGYINLIAGNHQHRRASSYSFAAD